jgi:DNA-binding Lrp family transcriptional regulator
MDQIDRNILNRIQHAFPVKSRPFEELGGELGLDENEMLERVRKLREQGYIRRMGPIFDPRTLGYVSTLCTLKTPQTRIDEVARVINAYPGVTHNYLRDHPYNIWFTLITRGEEGIRETIDQIKKDTGIDEILILPAERFYKLKVEFNVEG